MTGYGKSACFIFITVFSIRNGTAVQAEPIVRQVTHLTRSLRSDAELMDVAFVNASHGWAVGRQGTILYTADGGTRWSIQESGVANDLTSIHFIDASTGWVAGGWTEPFTGVSRGVILSTHDGGQTWSLNKRALVPKILKLKFFDRKRGWAITETCGLFPHGVFTTDDAGRTWTPLPVDGGKSWLCGDFLDPVSGALAARNGVLGAVRKRLAQASRSQFYGMRTTRDLVLRPDGKGFAVGDGDQVLATSDAGTSWQDLSSQLNPIERGFDFRAVAVHGEDVWCGRAPGSHVLRSSDGGRSWQAVPTGQRLPIRAMHFLDSSHGWAVGALGSILHTSDGGQNWQTQRAASRRAAWMAVFADVEQVPLTLVAKLSAAEGYSGVIHVVGRRDIDPRAASVAFRQELEAESLVRTGASAVEHAWQFALRPRRLRMPAEYVESIWDATNPGGGREALREYVLREILTWRPDVLIAPQADPRGKWAEDRELSQAVLWAVNQAAAAEGRESAWQVKRIYASVPEATAATINLSPTSLAPALANSIGDFVAPARMLLDRDEQQSTLRFQAVFNRGIATQVRGDFFGGIRLTRGGDARRSIEGAPQDVGQLRRNVDRRQITQAVVAASVRDRRSAAASLAQLNRLTSSISAEEADELLYQVGEVFHKHGRWSLASDVFATLAQRDSSPATRARQWLMHYHASAETAHLDNPLPVNEVRQVRAELPETITRPVVPPEQIELAAQSKRASLALEWAQHLKDSNLMLDAEPSTRLASGAVFRRLGKPRQAERHYLALQRSRPDDAWRDCASAELWLTRRSQRSDRTPAKPSKPIWPCFRISEKPVLDGKLNETVWRELSTGAADQPSRAIQLRSVHSDDASWPARVGIAYDDEYLYFAAICTKAPKVDYTVSQKPRARDSDLDDHDRIDLLLDTDRDWTSHYRLSIDSRGWTGDAFWASAAWNPKWFVAAAQTDQSWSCEIAIPVAELTSTPLPETIWAVGVQRVVPGVGFQSWTQPASPDILTEGFGLLEFK